MGYFTGKKKMLKSLVHWDETSLINGLRILVGTLFG